MTRSRFRIPRWLGTALVLASLLATTDAQASGAAYVQATAKAFSGPGSSYSLAFPANTTAGNLLLVAFDYNSGISPFSVTDSQGNSFFPVGNQMTSPGGTLSRVYYAKNILGGADTITVTFSANSGSEIYISEYTGIDPNNPVDVLANASGSAGAVSSGNATTTVAGDVIFGFCIGDWVCTAGSGFAARSNLNGNLVEDKLAGSAGSYAATGTANNGWTMQMVALKPASGSGVSAPVINSATSATGTVGTAFSYQITATNSPTSFGATNLPNGLSVSSITGLISGTPTAVGTSMVTISATNAGGTGSATLTLTINPAPPVITSPTSATGTVGTAFSYQITATNSPTSFGATNLPNGLSVSGTTGLISGTPTAVGVSSVTISATNAGGTGSATLTLTINPAHPVITSATSATGTVGTAFSYQITATNSPISFGAMNLPNGLSVSGTTGLISGTPTAVETSMVTISATNAGGTGSATLTLTINPAHPVITSPTSATGTVGTAFSYQITATNSPTSFGAANLPAGLSVSSTTGLISGTPTAAGTSMVTISATNAGGTGSATLTLTINPAPPVINSATSATGTVGTAFSYQITATNSPTSFGATNLPNGLSVSGTTGLISGTPMAAGTSSVTISATNAGGTGSATLAISITMPSDPPSFVQATANSAAGSIVSFPLAFSANTTAGNLLLAAFDYSSGASPSSVTDSQGNTFTPLGNPLRSPGGTLSRVYYAKNIRGGADTVTVTFSTASNGIELYLTEYTGIDPNNPIDALASASGSAGAVSSGNATTTVAGDVIFGFCIGDWVCTAGSGFAARSSFHGNLVEDKLAGSAGSYAATGTANNGWSMQMVALRPSSGSGVTPPVITSATSATGTAGTPFSYQITATNSPTSFGATNLPNGLSVSGTTGLISGTPTAMGTSSVTISATNAGGTGSATLTLTINILTLKTIVVSPQNAAIQDLGGAPSTQAYAATGYFSDGSVQDLTSSVTWASTNAAIASVSAGGVATSAALPVNQSVGFTSITATSGAISGVSILSVTNHAGNGFAGVFTQHNDLGRTGQNVNETVLTPTLVSSTTTFGKAFSQPVDGFIYGQPLYVPNVTIPGMGTHNVVYVVTEGDSVYAFDADSNTGANSMPLWQASLIDPVHHGATSGETTLTTSITNQCTDVIPQIGITSTPVIDPSSNTMYVEAVSVDTNGNAIHRLHALDITTGNETAQSPVVITASVPGTGDGGTTVTFNSLLQMNRPGVLLVNGTVYLAFGSHCDITPYHGWVLAYDARSLVQKGVFNATPNGGLGGIWMAGSGLAADSQANIFTVTGNGLFDTPGTPQDYGDSIFKLNLSSGALQLTDYFTPYDQNNRYINDSDLGSGGILLLPDQTGSHSHELVQSGKGGTIYVIDRDQMTVGNQHYCANCNSDPQVAEALPTVTGSIFSTPTYWNGTVYLWGLHDTLKAFPLTNGQLPTSPSSNSNLMLSFPGASTAVSASGATNGIIWAIDATQYGPPHQTTAGPAVLHAFDATNLANEFYNSTMAANNRDVAGNAVKFAVPTIANGKVYIGTQTELDVYGPIPH